MFVIATQDICNIANIVNIFNIIFKTKINYCFLSRVLINNVSRGIRLSAVTLSFYDINKIYYYTMFVHLGIVLRVSN